jgi:hypothetical protein
MTLNRDRFATLHSSASTLAPDTTKHRTGTDPFGILHDLFGNTENGCQTRLPGSPLPPESVDPHFQTTKQPYPGRMRIQRTPNKNR